MKDRTMTQGKVRTFDNTKFDAWRKFFDKEMVKRGLKKAPVAVAHGHYEIGDSPETAAEYIANS